MAWIASARSATRSRSHRTPCRLRRAGQVEHLLQSDGRGVAACGLGVAVDGVDRGTCLGGIGERLGEPTVPSSPTRRRARGEPPPIQIGRRSACGDFGSMAMLSAR